MSIGLYQKSSLGNPDIASFITSSDTELDLLEDSAIPIKRIQKAFSKSKCKLKIFIIDSCYSGVSFGKANGSMSPDFENTLNDMVSEGWIIFASCKGTEVSHALQDSSMSVFTHYLVSGLQGNAIQKAGDLLSFENLTSYVTNRVAKWALDNHTSQTPNTKGELVGKIIFKIAKPEISQEPIISVASPTNIIDKMTLHNFYSAPEDTGNPMYTLRIRKPGEPEHEFRKYSHYERNEMRDSRLKGAIDFLFTEMIKYYKPSEIVKRSNYLYSMPFGQFEVNISNYKYSAKLDLRSIFSDEIVKGFLRSIDAQREISWRALEFQTKILFDYDIVLSIAKSNKYVIEKFNPADDEIHIEIPTNKIQFAFSNSEDIGKIIFFKDDSLPNEFYDAIPSKEIIEIFRPSMKAITKPNK